MSQAQNAGGGAAHRTDGGEQLVKMANDIGRFFRAEPVREDAVAGIASHMGKYWTKRMRDKLRAYLAQAGADGGLEELPREAFQRLEPR
ncbi:MAG TPA: formate dehydrogenase subunit delta [Steroidobacteraceae bacterium]|jgi:formate dehydrogenase subunit delta|nr:formate dehydrogenase subunit delta [Steroidobacteraceae bacterium]